MGRCLLQAKELPTKFWVEVVYYSNYLLNLILTRAVSDMNPIKKWSIRKPSISHLRTFGCIARDHILYDCRKKLEDKSHACIMSGYYIEEFKSYQLFDLVKHQIIIRRNDIFNNNILGMKLLNSSSILLHSNPLILLKKMDLTISFLGKLTRQSTLFP